jgi:alginate O-acetyltransferase complex protein AlgJ
MEMKVEVGAARAHGSSSAVAERWLVVALFFALISAPAVTQIASIGRADIGENRVLAPSPQWVGFRRLRDFAKATDAYIDDHFGLRDRLVRWNSLLRYRLGVSSTPKVVIGSHGWLFYAGAGEKILEQHTGENVFTPAELERWVEVITADRDWLAQRGIPLFIVIAPDKSTIYPEKLPAYPRLPGRTTRADQLVERLRRTDLVVIDPRQAMIDAKPGTRSYFEGDSHWTHAGAFMAYRQLMERVQARLPSAIPLTRDDFEIAPAHVAHDLAFLLALHNDLAYMVERWTPRAARQIRTTTRDPAPGSGWGWPVRFIENDLKDRPRALIFGDSFTDYVLGPTFLYETFRDPVYTHHNGATLNFRLVAEAKPDLVIVQLAERYLALPPQVPLGF